MTTQKTAGSPCPKCDYHPCSERRSMTDTVTRWSCASCGAGGEIAGTATPAVQKATGPHKHWRDPTKIKAE